MRDDPIDQFRRALKPPRQAVPACVTRLLPPAHNLFQQLPSGTDARIMGFLPALEETANGSPTLGRSEVRDIFSMACDEWVRSYLLGSDPYEEARLLMEPVQSMHTLSGEHVFTVNKTVTGLDQPKVLSRWLLMPACNRGSKAAGLFISDKSDDACDDGSAMHFVRFVRDDNTGEVLYITEMDENSIEVMHTKVDGPTKRTATYLRFDATRFRRVFQADSRADVARLVDALLTSCTITETRPCPACNTTQASLCQCSLALQPAAHSLDFRFYRRNSDHMFGTFSGKMTLSTYAAGQERSCQSYHVENATRCTSNTLTVQLLRGAVQNRVRLLKANPRNATIPGTTSANIAPAMTLSMGGSGIGTSAWVTKLKPVGAQHRSWSASYQVMDTNYWPPENAASDFGNAVDALMDGDTVDLTEPAPSSPVSAILSDVSSCTPPGSLRSSAATTKALPPPPPPPRVVVAPRLAATLLPRANVDTTLSGSDPLADKAMMRKIKKREAAERSNTRRHLRHVELKQALKDIREREQMLRKKKAELEEERLQLQVRLDAAVLAFETEGTIEDFLMPPNIMSPGTSMRSLSEILNCA